MRLYYKVEHYKVERNKYESENYFHYVNIFLKYKQPWSSGYLWMPFIVP